MSPEAPLPAATASEIHAHLHAIAVLLREPHQLDSAARTALADLVDELDRNLQAGQIPGAEAARVAAMASQFADAVHRADESGVLQSARARLEEAVLAAEIKAPMVAGLARRFMDALSNIGI